MKKRITGIIVISVYLVIITFLLDFNISLLFEWKSFVLVILGTGLLSVTSIRRNMQKSEVLNIMASNSIVASFVVVLIFLFSGTTVNEIMDFKGMIAIGCRPLLYGIIIYSILHVNEQENMVIVKTVEDEKETKNSVKTYRQQGLTRRETEIVFLIQKGLSNKEIAEELFIAETTVKKHISHIFEKLDIQKREELISGQDRKTL